MTSPEHESEQARQLREGVQIVQLDVAAQRREHWQLAAAMLAAGAVVLPVHRGLPAVVVGVDRGR